MARKGKMKNVDVRQLVKLVNKGGQKAAADQFACSQSSISRILTAAGYRPRIIYVKAEEQTS